jgi:AAA15 family ATPase/GTPase
MLESLSIKNFRSFRSLQVEPLARVNLIVGKNNAGKTNLLDAISIYAAAADLNWIAQTLARRELLHKNYEKFHDFILTDEDERVFSSLFTNWHKSDSIDNQITIEAVEQKNTKQHVALRLVRLVNQSNLNGNGKFNINVLQENEQSELPVIRGFQTFSPTHKYKMMIFGGDIGFHMPPELEYFIPFRYISTRIQRITESDEVKLWGKISISPLKSFVLDALKIVDNRIVDFNYIPSQVVENLFIPHVRLEGIESPTPLYSLGDGIRRVLTVILNLISAKDGLLLIDEFENGLHYTIQEPLWTMIFQIAEQLNVQVFATTHSGDCLWAFAEVLKENGHSGQGKVLRLSKGKDDVHCSMFSSQELVKVFDQELEIR